MASDDRDIESSSPAAGFGDVDRLSGFFTPVWESKKRIRSETPIPSSRTPRAKAASPSSGTDAGMDAAAQRKRSSAQKAARTKTTGQADGAGRSKKGSSAEESPSHRASAEKKKGKDTTKRATAAYRTSSEARPTIAVGSSPTRAGAPKKSRDTSPAAQLVASAAGRKGAPVDSSEPELPPEAFFDEEPEFRLPSIAQTESPRQRIVRERSHRATTAATHLHEQLKARWKADAERDAEDAVRDSRAVPAPADDPLSAPVVRRFRRTIPLSSPLPEPLRSSVVRSRDQ